MDEKEIKAVNFIEKLLFITESGDSEKIRNRNGLLALRDFLLYDYILPEDLDTLTP